MGSEIWEGWVVVRKPMFGVSLFSSLKYLFYSVKGDAT